MAPPAGEDFIEELARLLSSIEALGLSFADIKAGDLHRIVGGYPDSNHRMPVCSDVMYDMMGPGDQVLCSPPKGKGATLVIRYGLPRPDL